MINVPTVQKRRNKGRKCRVSVSLIASFVGMQNLEPVGRVADPDLFGRSWIRKTFTGSGSYGYFGNVE